MRFTSRQKQPTLPVRLELVDDGDCVSVRALAEDGQANILLTFNTDGVVERVPLSDSFTQKTGIKTDETKRIKVLTHY